LFCGGFGNRLEELGVLVSNAVSRNVLRDFFVYGLLIRLVDLNNFFDLPTQIP
jgi:hypothetical protein